MRTTIELFDAELRDLVIAAARKAAPHISGKISATTVSFTVADRDRGTCLARVVFTHEMAPAPSGSFYDR